MELEQSSPAESKSGRRHFHRRSWTKDEDELLKGLISVHGCKRGRPNDSRWGEIAKSLPGRTNKDIRKRWFHSLDPALRKGRWTEEEDQIILEAYERLGPAWKEIAALLQGRKDDQVSKRYNDMLAPGTECRLSNWTQEEDEYLTEQVTTHGHKWVQISTGLPGRPPLTCRNRWRHLKRSSVRAQSQSSQSQSQSAPGPSSFWPNTSDLADKTNGTPAAQSSIEVGWSTDSQTNLTDFEQWPFTPDVTGAEGILASPSLAQMDHVSQTESTALFAPTPTSLMDTAYTSDLTMPSDAGASLLGYGTGLMSAPPPLAMNDLYQLVPHVPHSSTSASFVQFHQPQILTHQPTPQHITGQGPYNLNVPNVVHVHHHHQYHHYYHYSQDDIDAGPADMSAFYPPNI